MKPAIFFFFISLALLSFPGIGQTIHYVDIKATGSNDGSSWPNAFTELQPALDAAAIGDEVWIASGTYLPTEAPDEVSMDDRDKSFHFDQDIKLYGGFAGVETQLEERDTQTNIAILSGDFANDDVIIGSGGTLSISGNTENAYHVLITANLSSASIIDGFTIKRGNSNGIDSDLTYGGKEFSRQKGGGIYNIGSSPTISEIVFEENNSGVFAGGLMSEFSSSEINTCTFNRNNAFIGGGMVLVDTSSSPHINHVTFKENRANTGGGMVNSGGMPNIDNSIFIGNSADNNGGAIWNTLTEASFNNLLFIQNTANNGGAIYNSGSSPSIINTTIAKNTAETGGGMYNKSILSDHSFPNIQNTIIWSNSATGSANSVFNESSSIPIYSYNLIEGSGGSGDLWNTELGTDNGNNLDVDPLFIDTNDPDGTDNNLGTEDDGFALTICSPAINAGNNDGILEVDISGNSRRFNEENVDIGAYEFQGESGLFEVVISGNENLSEIVTSVTRTASGGISYQWSDNLGTNASASITSPGTYMVTSTSADGCIETAFTTVSIAPVITNNQDFDVLENAQNGTVIGLVQATDADAGITTFSNWTIVSGNEANIFNLNSTSGEVSIADNTLLDKETMISHTIGITVSDGTQVSETETIIITVGDVNEAPILTTIGMQTGDTNGTINFIASATDVDVPKQTLEYSIDQVSIDKGMIINILSGMFEWSPAIEGNHTVTVTVSDGSLMDFELVNIAVNTLQVLGTKDNSIAIYPNPARDLFFVTGSTHARFVALYSLSGQRVLFKENEGELIDIHSLKKGTYIVEILGETGKKIHQSKLVIID